MKSQSQENRPGQVWRAWALTRWHLEPPGHLATSPHPASKQVQVKKIFYNHLSKLVNLVLNEDFLSKLVSSHNDGIIFSAMTAFYLIHIAT